MVGRGTEADTNQGLQLIASAASHTEHPLPDAVAVMAAAEQIGSMDIGNESFRMYFENENTGHWKNIAETFFKPTLQQSLIANNKTEGRVLHLQAQLVQRGVIDVSSYKPASSNEKSTNLLAAYNMFQIAADKFVPSQWAAGKLMEECKYLLAQSPSESVRRL